MSLFRSYPFRSCPTIKMFLYSLFLLLVLAKRVADMTYYNLLEVPADADEGQLKKAYRKLALKHHPDKLPPDSTEEDKKNAENTFAEISVAYDTLSNPEKRRYYDQVGVEGVKQGGGGGGGGGFPGGIDPHKIFEQFFGGGGFPDMGGAGGGGNGFQFSSNGGSFTFTMHSGGGGGGGGGGPFGGMGGGGGGGGGPDGIFSQFFGGGGGPGGGGGQQQQRQERVEQQQRNPWGNGEYFEDADETIQTVKSDDGFQEVLNGSSGGKTRFCAILYVKGAVSPQGEDAKPLGIRDTVLKIAKSYKNAGVKFLAANCEQTPGACSTIEQNVQQYPHIVFFPSLDDKQNADRKGDRVRKSISGRENSASEKILNNFFNDAWPTDKEKIQFLKSVSDKEKFLKSKDKSAKIVFITDKKSGSAPPIIRGLAEDLEDKVDFAIAGPKIDDVTYRSFSVPESQKLPCFYDPQTMKFFTKPAESLRSYIIAVYKAFVKSSKNVAKILLLTDKEILGEGKCGKKDYRFCLLAVMGDLSGDVEAPLLEVAREFKKESADPVRVHWVKNGSGAGEEGAGGVLGKLVKDVSDAQSSGVGNGPQLILWRPKRGKFEVFSGDFPFSGESVLSWVRGFIDGGKALKQRHSDIWEGVEAEL